VTETGTVTRKTDDQRKVPARTPPGKMPVVPPSPEAAPPDAPGSGPRWTGRVSRTSEIAAGLSAAASAAWMMWPAMSIVGLAAVVRRVPEANRVAPAMNMRRRRTGPRPDQT